MPSPRLNSDQIRARSELLGAVSSRTGIAPPGWIGFYGLDSEGKLAVLASVAQPSGNARPHVVAGLIDANALPSYLKPWQYLLSVTLDCLVEHALPGESRLIEGMRSELLDIAQRGSAMSREALDVATEGFARRFRAMFPSLVNSVIQSTQSVLVISLTGLDTAPASASAELLEAAAYFLAAQACRVILVAEEGALMKRLASGGLDSDTALRKVTTRVELGRVPLAARDVLAATARPAPDAANPVGAAAEVRPPQVAKPPAARMVPVMFGAALASMAPVLAIGVGALFMDQLAKTLMRPMSPTRLLGGVLQLGSVAGPSPDSLLAGALPILVEMLGLGIALLIAAMAAMRTDVRQPRMQTMGLALALGGFVSNLLDRAVGGAVLNYIQLATLPVFNLAHVWIALGALMVAWSAWRYPARKR